jgi:hypothetical protein
VDPRAARLERGNKRCVPREDADLTGRTGNDQHLDLALEGRPFGRDEREVEGSTILRHWRG